MKDHQVDILCMQEYMDRSGDKNNSQNYLNYFTSKATGRNDMVIFSRYPIVIRPSTSKATNNSGMWADVSINGNIVRVFNVHLEITSINRTPGQAAKLVEQRPDGIEIFKVKRKSTAATHMA